MPTGSMSGRQAEDARIMIVDDEPQNVRYVVDVLTWAGYGNIEGFTDPVEAVGRFAEYRPDLVILDLLMPGMDGFATLEAMREDVDEDEYLPFLILTSDISSESRRRALSSGARDFLTKPLSPTEVRLRVDNLLETRFLYLELAGAQAASAPGRGPSPPPSGSADHVELLERWGASLESMLPGAEGRAKRVAWLAGRLAQALELSEEEADRVRNAALLHLLGARQVAGVAPGPDDGRSWSSVVTDPEGGARLLEGVSLPVLQTARRMLASVQENWDGTGEPAGLRGEAIPLEARILAVARAWDDASGDDGKRMADLEARGGGRFDPRVVEALALARAAGT